jgi:diaminopimelate decarboxylase
MSLAQPGSEPFSYRENQLYCEDAALEELAERYGTPLYVYSRRAIEGAYGAYDAALKGRSALVCYAVKANSNLAVLDVLARLNAGFDIVSGGELARVLAAGGDVGKTVFSGVGKSEPEIEAALKANVACFNLESSGELDRIDSVAQRLRRRARVALRVNPDIDARTHRHISTGLKNNKFGVAYDDTLALCRLACARPALELTGLGCHIGSQITEIAPYVEASTSGTLCLRSTWPLPS